MLAPNPNILLIIVFAIVSSLTILIISFMGLLHICQMGPWTIPASNHTRQESRGRCWDLVFHNSFRLALSSG